jgi:hypothetical protein
VTAYGYGAPPVHGFGEVVEHFGANGKDYGIGLTEGVTAYGPNSVSSAVTTSYSSSSFSSSADPHGGHGIGHSAGYGGLNTGAAAEHGAKDILSDIFGSSSSSRLGLGGISRLGGLGGFGGLKGIESRYGGLGGLRGIESRYGGLGGLHGVQGRSYGRPDYGHEEVSRYGGNLGGYGGRQGGYDGYEESYAPKSYGYGGPERSSYGRPSSYNSSPYGGAERLGYGSRSSYGAPKPVQQYGYG